MSDSDRRTFLKKLAKTTAYSAPVVRTLAAPDPAMGQALSMKKGMGMDMDGGWMKGWDPMGTLSDGSEGGSGFLRDFGPDGFGPGDDR